MQSDCHLWIAFQPNTLKDFNLQLPKEWPQMISDMRSRLANRFYIPTLSYNLRNSSEVYTMTDAVKFHEHTKTKIRDSLGVTTVAMTIHATVPKLIPIMLEEQEDRMAEVVGDAIMFAVERTREETEDPNSSFVILNDKMLRFSSDEIFRIIKSKKSQHDHVFKYPPNRYDRSPSLDYLDDLLKNNVQGFLVMNDKSFKGSESQNLILLIHDGGFTVDLRCNMLRCISNLSIILVIENLESLKFDKVRLFDKFISCSKDCEGSIYICKTCVKEQENELGEQKKKNVFICRFCKMRKSCHMFGHEFKDVSVKDDLKVKQVHCGCKCSQ